MMTSRDYIRQRMGQKYLEDDIWYFFGSSRITGRTPRLQEKDTLRNIMPRNREYESRQEITIFFILVLDSVIAF